jgi:hypothetical protein
MSNLNQQLLAAALPDPAISTLSDAAAATALSVPIYTDVAPSAVAQVIDTRQLRVPLVAAQSNANAQFSGLAIAALGVINAAYPLIKMSDPEISSLVLANIQGLVTAGILSTADQAAIIALTQSYRCGDVVAASDVTAARAALSLVNAKTSLLAWLATQYQEAIATCDAGQVSGTLPTKSQLQALFV